MSEDAHDYEHKVTDIKGYRQLSKAEIDLINKFKADEANILTELNYWQSPGLSAHQGVAMNQHSLTLARTKFQEAYMWLNRAVARPNGE